MTRAGVAGRYTSRGIAVVQISCARGQRGWNTQPLGGLAGLGTSPSRTMRRRDRSVCGSGIGTAESSASVYGCCGMS